MKKFLKWLGFTLLGSLLVWNFVMGPILLSAAELFGTEAKVYDAHDTRATFVENAEQILNSETGYPTGNYHMFDDGKSGTGILVRITWDLGGVADAWLLQNGDSWLVEKTYVQNVDGELILWQLPPDPTPTPMPTVQLGDPCTLSFVECPATSVP